MSVKRIRRRNAFPRRYIRLILSFIWIRIAAAGRFIAVSPPARRVVRLRAVRFLVRLLVLLWSRFIWPAWRWCKRSVRLVRKFLGRHEVWSWVVAWGCCAGLGYAILQAPPEKVGVAVVGAILLAFLLRRLEWGIIAVAVMVASFMHHGAIPRPISLGGMGPNVAEILILAMLAVVFARSCRRGKFLLFKSPMTLPLMLLYLSVVMSVLESYRLFKLVTAPDLFYVGQIYSNARPMFFYLFFFIVAFGIQTERQLRFVLRASVWVAAIVGLMVAAQYYIGPQGVSLFIGGGWSAGYTASVSPEEQAVARSMPPGLALICMFFLITIAHAAYRGSRSGIVNLLGALPLGAGLVFSFYRSFWVSTFVGLFVIWMACSAVVKRRLLVYGAVVVVVTVFGTVSFAKLVPGKAGQDFARVLADRFTSLSQSSTYEVEDSLQARLRENRMAIQRIKENPIFGIGSGTPRQWSEWVRPGTYTRIVHPLYFIHNSYLELWMVYGILGFVSFVWLSIIFLLRCFVLFRTVQNPAWKGVTIGCFAGYIGFLIRANTQMHIVHDYYHIVACAMVWGIIEVIARLHSQGQLSKDDNDSIAPEPETPAPYRLKRRSYVGLAPRRVPSRSV